MGFCCLPFEEFTCENRLRRRLCTPWKVCNYDGRYVKFPRTPHRCLTDGYVNEFSEFFLKKPLSKTVRATIFKQFDFDSTAVLVWLRSHQILWIGKKKFNILQKNTTLVLLLHFHKYENDNSICVFRYFMIWCKQIDTFSKFNQHETCNFEQCYLRQFRKNIIACDHCKLPQIGPNAKCLFQLNVLVLRALARY